MGLGFFSIYGLFGAAILQAEEVNEFRECAAIDESADRLACYDRTMTRLPLPDNASTQQSADAAPAPLAEQIAPVAETAPSAEQIAPIAESAPSAEQIAAVAEPPSRPMASVAANPAGANEQTFDLPKDAPEADDIATADGEPDLSSAEDQFTAIVTKVTRRIRGEHVALGVGKEISWVQVGMKKSVAEYLTQKGAQQICDDGCGLDPGVE